jgi:hypothetical protein
MSLNRRLALVGALAAFAALIPASAASADAFGPQVPLTSVGTPGDAEFPAGFQDLAYNPATGQYLLVFVAATSTDTDDVYGQFVDASGNPVGPAFRISETSLDEDEFDPTSVIVNPETNEYLVAWGFNDTTVFVRRLAANGTPLGSELPVSGVQSDIEGQALAYSPVSHEYLVAWKALGAGRVFAQRLTSTAVQVGPDDAIVGGSAALTVDDAMDVVYNATSQEYLVVFNARPASGDEEVYGQRLGLDASQIGLDDFQISDMGPPASATFQAAPPSVAWNSTLNQYLVGWQGDDDTPPLVDGELEVFGQLLAADGTPIGVDDFRISDMGADGTTPPGAFRPRIHYDANGRQYFLAWHGDDITGSLVNGEFEVYGQYLAPDGAQIGNNDFRISENPPDGDAGTSGTRPAIAYNSAICNYLVAFMSGGSPSGGGDWEVAGRRVTAPPCPAPPPAPLTPGPARDTTAPSLTRLRVSPKLISASVGALPAQRRRARPRRTTLRYSLSENATVRFTLQRKTRGRRVSGRCRKQTPRNRSRPRCTRWVGVGRGFSQRGRAGANRKVVGPGTVRRRTLVPGGYRVLARATDAAGNRSARRSVGFRVVPRVRR